MLKAPYYKLDNTKHPKCIKHTGQTSERSVKSKIKRSKNKTSAALSMKRDSFIHRSTLHKCKVTEQIMVQNMKLFINAILEANIYIQVNCSSTRIYPYPKHISILYCPIQQAQKAILVPEIYTTKNNT